MKKTAKYRIDYRQLLLSCWISICLLAFSFQAVFGQTSQNITYEYDGTTYKGKVIITQKIWHANNVSDAGTQADFNVENGVSVKIERVNWDGEEPDELPKIELKWIKLNHGFIFASKPKSYELKRNEFKFKKGENQDYSQPFNISINIGYGYESQQGRITVNFKNQPPDLIVEAEPEVDEITPQTNQKPKKPTPKEESKPIKPSTKRPLPNKSIASEEPKSSKKEEVIEEEFVVSKEDTSLANGLPLAVDNNDSDQENSSDKLGPESTSILTEIQTWVESNPAPALGIVIGAMVVLFLIFRKRKSPYPQESLDIETKKINPVIAEAKKEGQMRIKSKTSVSNSKETPSEVSHIPFIDLPNHADIQAFDLEEVWKKTLIKRVYLPPKPAREIQSFIEEKNRNIFQEDDQLVPEIGGFLLGRQNKLGSRDQYEVIIDEFVPITPEDQNVYKVEFGTQAWTELDEVQGKFPGLIPIGWFHTHPGHGLFLSQPDINIQKGFFAKPFHLAMEIDPLKDRCDMAFFTWSGPNQLNNSSQRLTNNWYSWKEIMNSVKKHIA